MNNTETYKPEEKQTAVAPLHFSFESRSGNKQMLHLVDHLFSGLHDHGITYCHWKSNEHLEASFTGETDLDILFDPSQKERLGKFLSDAGFKKFFPVRQKLYREIEDFIGLDSQSGKIVHLHAHYRLTMGEPYLKGYQLRLQQLVLDTRVYDSAFGMYRTSPPLELILMFFRQALKLRFRDKWKIILNRKTLPAENLIREYMWLVNQSSAEQIMEIATKYFTDGRKIADTVNGPFNQKQFLKLSSILKTELRNERLFNPLSALLYRWYREISLKTNRRLAKLTHWPIVQKRIALRGGLVVAVIGADGSGKSTVIKNLHSTFSKKLDVYTIYYGNGGHTTWARRASNLFRKNKTATPSRKPISDPPGSNVKKYTAARTFLKIFDAIEIAILKDMSLKRMRMAKSKGMLVICDRYPQNQVMGLNDGPRLNHLLHAGNPLFRRIAQWERNIFSKFEKEIPDIVFKLIADADIVASRKPGQTPLHILEAKIKAIKDQKFPDGCAVVTIDSSAPPERVLYTIKNTIWKII